MESKLSPLKKLFVKVDVKVIALSLLLIYGASTYYMLTTKPDVAGADAQTASQQCPQSYASRKCVNTTLNGFSDSPRIDRALEPLVARDADRSNLLSVYHRENQTDIVSSEGPKSAFSNSSEAVKIVVPKSEATIQTTKIK